MYQKTEKITCDGLQMELTEKRKGDLLRDDPSLGGVFAVQDSWPTLL